MITNEVRAKIFALYLGCDIAVSHRNQPDCIGKLLPAYLYANDGVTLILTPISEITNEDAIEVARMCNMLFKNALNNGTGLSIQAIEYGKIWTKNPDYKIVDFLRSKGYMLPAYGIEDLFEAGIAIKKETV